MNREQELEHTIETARGELYKIRNRKDTERASTLVSKFYKYHNSYSCPESDKDRWWLYMAIIKAERGSLYTESFQKDMYGALEIHFDQSRPLDLSEGYIEISRDEYVQAWNSICSTRLADSTSKDEGRDVDTAE